MTDPYAPVPITIPDDHPMFASQTFAAWPSLGNPLIAMDYATGRIYVVELDENGKVCKVEECPT